MDHDQVNLPSPDEFHQSIQALAGKARAGNLVADFLHHGPAMALAIASKGVELLLNRLLVSGNPAVNRDFH